MKPGKLAVRTALVVVPLAAALTLAALSTNGCRGDMASLMARLRPRKSRSKENTTAYAGNVEQVVNSSRLTILKWSNYSDYQSEVQRFYNDRNYELAWTRDGRPTPATMQLIGLFEKAALKGLRPGDYDAERWPFRLQKLETIRTTHDTSDNAQDNIAQFDAAVTISTMRYLSDLHLGRINPQTLNFDIDVPARRAAFDLPGYIDAHIVDATDVATAVQAVEPQNAKYAATEQELGVYLELARDQDASGLAPLPQVARTISVGGWYPALQALLMRLLLEGDAAMTITRVPRFYDADLAVGVRHYQERHGMTADGKLTRATIESLNVPLDARVSQLDDSLERWRWLPENFANPRVFINLPEFMVRAYNPDRTLAFEMKVVDGEGDGIHDTPMFVRSMRYVVFRPYWNLPPDIVKKELVAHLNGSDGEGYLESHGYQVTNAAGKPVTHWTVDDLAHARYNVRQMPGPKNSLGLVKFLFPNEYDVYMHSTPEMNLFHLTVRDKSHGCVRLQDAEAMADWVLAGQGKWDSDSIHDAMYGSDATDNKWVTLQTPLPVLVGYFTALPEEDGTVHFFDDLYGYDQQLETALAKGMPYEQAPVKINPKLTLGETE